MMRLRSLLSRLNPATKIEIVDNLQCEDREIVYRGDLLKLSYCKAEKILDRNVEEILDRNFEELREKSEEREYCIVIKVGYNLPTEGGR